MRPRVESYGFALRNASFRKRFSRRGQSFRVQPGQRTSAILGRKGDLPKEADRGIRRLRLPVRKNRQERTGIVRAREPRLKPDGSATCEYSAKKFGQQG